MIISKTNIATNQDYYLQILTPGCNEIEIENVYDNSSKNKGVFDFSYYPAKSKYYDDSNALVVGKMKDEMGKVAIEEFVGLKPKCTPF